MIPFKLTALTRATPFIQRQAEARQNFLKKTVQNFTQFSFTISIFNQISRFSLNPFFSNTALRHFKRKIERNRQFTMDEDQEMETQPVYLTSDESELTSPCSSLIPPLPNNIPDTYYAIAHILAAQHEQMSLSGTSALQYATTPPTSLISDDENYEVLTPKIGNPAQFLPYILNRHPIALQLCQQITPIPNTPKSPTPENRGQTDNFRTDDIPDHPSSTFFNNPRPQYNDSR